MQWHLLSELRQYGHPGGMRTLQRVHALMWDMEVNWKAPWTRHIAGEEQHELQHRHGQCHQVLHWDLWSSKRAFQSGGQIPDNTDPNQCNQRSSPRFTFTQVKMKRKDWRRFVGSVDGDDDANDEGERSQQRLRTIRSDEARVATLPASLVRAHVFSFLTPVEDALSDNGIAPRRVNAALVTVRSVCLRWRVIAEVIGTEVKQRVCCLELKNGAADEVVRLKQQANKEGPRAEQVEIIMGYVRQRDGEPSVFCLHKALRLERLVEFPWEDIGNSASLAIRLDLSLMAFAVLRAFLDKVAQRMSHVQALVLPLQPEGYRVEEIESERTTESLIAALSGWHARNGRLKVLCMTWWPKVDQGLSERLERCLVECCQHARSSPRGRRSLLEFR